MRTANCLKKYWWLAILILGVLILNIAIFDMYVDLKNPKKVLNKTEMHPELEQNLHIDEKINKLKKTKMLYQKSKELNDLLDDLKIPASRKDSLVIKDITKI